MSYNIDIKKRDEVIIYGLKAYTNDIEISRSIPELSAKYYSKVGKDSPLPFYVVTENYNLETKAFDLFVGGNIEARGLGKKVIPKGLYAIAKVRPKLGLFWGASIGATKRYFYNKYIKNSKYTPLNLEYEYHTIDSISKNPYIELYFNIKSIN